MAFNWQTFRTRTLTAIVFAGVMLAGLLWNKWSFFILFSIIHFGCWWEYLKLVEKIHNTSFHPYIKMGLIVMGYGLLIGFCGPTFQLNGYGINENFCLPVSVAGLAILLVGIFQKNLIRIKAFAMAAAGWVYISLSLGLMMDLYSFYPGRTLIKGPMDIVSIESPEHFLPLIIILTIWIADTMAYLVGSMIGKTPITKVSPKKTWEGTIGGIVLAVGVIGSAIIIFLPNSTTSLHWFLLPATACIFGFLGDLVESKLKRMAGVKDSGSFMPGHGGFLDRFDSMLLAIPFVWLYVQLFLQ